MHTRTIVCLILLSRCVTCAAFTIGFQWKANSVLSTVPMSKALPARALDDDFDDDDDYYDKEDRESLEDETPTIELQPLPMSKNAGNRFVAFLWSRELDTGESDPMHLHENHIALTEDHVMFCRKANLYNETFNTESMVDVVWSHPILASDLQRVIGQALCLESTALGYIQEFLETEPICKMYTGGDASKIPLYRWRHIRDYTLRIDDGRFGFPCMCLALDDEPEEIGSLREDNQEALLQYWIRSKKVIAAGPLYMPTEFKDDPSSIPVGDLVLFNAKDRDDAVEWVEGFPSAETGQYSSMRVHFYNRLDVSGKFVSEDRLRDAPCHQMQEALEAWGYPTGDDQTPWLIG